MLAFHLKEGVGLMKVRRVVCVGVSILIVPILHAESESATTPPTPSHIGRAEQPGSGE